MALRLALIGGPILLQTFEAAGSYRSPVSQFGASVEGADYGQREIDRSGPAARRVIRKIARNRTA